MEQYHRFMEFMRPHWNTLALAATWIGIGIIALRRRRQWKRKQFLTQVNFSLNYLLGDDLAMRTLVETSASRVWPNEYGVKKVFAAARRTADGNPFILLPDPKDQDFINRAVLNVLSERFAEGFVAAALGLPVRSATFCFVLTFERHTEMRTLKLRVLLIEERTLGELFGNEGRAARLKMGNPIYQIRLNTLRLLHELYVKDRTLAKPRLGRVELGVSVAGNPDLAGSLGTCATSATTHA